MAAAISSFGSSKCLNGTGCSFRNSSASERLSFEFTPMNTTSPLRFSACSLKNGNSSRQGPHQDAHLFTTTGVPRSFSIRASKASRPPLKKLAVASAPLSELHPAYAIASTSTSGGGGRRPRAREGEGGGGPLAARGG